VVLPERRTRRNHMQEGDVFALPLLVFAIVGAVMAAIMVLSVVHNCRREGQKRREASEQGKRSIDSKKLGEKFGRVLKTALALEIFVEDIPQFVLTTLVSLRRRGGVFTPQAVFNLTTSSMNFVLNLLDMIEIENDDDGNDGNNNNEDEGTADARNTVAVPSGEFRKTLSGLHDHAL